MKNKDMFHWIDNWIGQLIIIGRKETSQITQDDIIDLVSSISTANFLERIVNPPKLTEEGLLTIIENWNRAIQPSNLNFSTPTMLSLAKYIYKALPTKGKLNG